MAPQTRSASQKQSASASDPAAAAPSEGLVATSADDAAQSQAAIVADQQARLTAGNDTDAIQTSDGVSQPERATKSGRKRGRADSDAADSKTKKARKMKKRGARLPIPALPDELLVEIFQHSHPKTLFKLEKACRSFREILDDERIWLAAREGQCPDMEEPPHDMSEKAFLSLVLGKGCELCGTARIRKVHWAYGIRACKPCVLANTISDWRLQTYHKINETVLVGLPYEVVYLWNRRFGQYSIHCYWTAHVDEIYEEYKAAKEGGKSALKEWFAGQNAVGRQARMDARRLEAWEQSKRASRRIEGAQSRAQRAEDIVRRSAPLLGKGLIPPIPRAFLERLPTFQTTRMLSHPLTERSWRIISSRLLQEAEAMHEKDAQRSATAAP